jgi:hypothetical protein
MTTPTTRPNYGRTPARRRPTAPLAADRQQAHRLAVEARESLGLNTYELRAAPPTDAAGWLSHLNRIRRAKAAVLELELLAASAAAALRSAETEEAVPA